MPRTTKYLHPPFLEVSGTTENTEEQIPLTKTTRNEEHACKRIITRYKVLSKLLRPHGKPS